MIKGKLIFAFILASALSLNAQTYNNADLPDALTFLDGTRVETKSDWEKRTKEIKNLWCDFYIGHFPSEVPELLSAKVIKTEIKEDGTTRKRIVLKYDTPHKKSFEIEVWEPVEMGKIAHPLFLTQPREYQVQWAEEAVKRGYIACLYPGLDAHHNEKDYPGYQNVWKIFKDEYPEADWASSLGIQAWLASWAHRTPTLAISGVGVRGSSLRLAPPGTTLAFAVRNGRVVIN